MTDRDEDAPVHNFQDHFLCRRFRHSIKGGSYGHQDHTKCGGFEFKMPEKPVFGKKKLIPNSCMGFLFTHIINRKKLSLFNQTDAISCLPGEKLDDGGNTGKDYPC